MTKQQPEPKEKDEPMTDATAATAADEAHDEPGADVVQLDDHRGEIERATGHMQIGGMTIDRDLLSRTIAKELNDDELDLFIAVCNRTGLDPFAKQIYAIKRRGKMGIQTSIDGFRLIAERSGRYAGQTAVEWCGQDKIWTDVWLSSDAPAAARVGVYKAGFAEPLVRIATWDQYAQYDNDRRLTPMWQKMGPLMLGKCAEALALRAGFPAELSGLYTDDEMQQAENATYAGSRGIGAAAPIEVEPVDVDALEAQRVDLQVRVAALPDELRSELAETWKNVDRLRGIPLRVLPFDHLRLVESLVRGAETKASKVDGWEAGPAFTAKWTSVGRGVVFVLSGLTQQLTSDAQEPPAAPAPDESTETHDDEQQPASDDESAAVEDETSEQRAERARAVAAEAGLQPASTLLGSSDPSIVEVNESHVYPLVEPPAIEPDDPEIANRMSEAQIDVVIEYVRKLDNATLNKALRAHGVKHRDVAENVRRQRLSLAVLREIERQQSGE